MPEALSGKRVSRGPKSGFAPTDLRRFSRPYGLTMRNVGDGSRVRLLHGVLVGHAIAATVNGGFMSRSRITLLGVVMGALAVAGCERKLSDPKPDTVVVTLSPSEVSADDGGTVATAFVTEKRVPLKGFAVSFEVALLADSGANPSYALMNAVTDVNGRATVALSGLSVAGDGSVTATAVNGDGEPITRGGIPVAGSAPLAVRAGGAVSLDAELSASSVDLTNVDSIDVSYVVRDAQGNLTSDPVEIVTDHPGATVLAATIANLGAAGNWSVTVSVVGNPSVSDTESFQVLPSAGAIIDTFLSNSTTDAYADPALHPPVTVGYRVTDGTGNDVTADSSVLCTISGLSGGAVEASTSRIFPLVVKGTFPVTCSLLDALGGLVDADAETLTVFDLTPPAVSIVSPLPGTTFLADELFTAQVRGQDLVGVSQLTGQLVGLGDNTFESHLVAVTPNTDVTVPLLFRAANNQNTFGGAQTIYALGFDGSGNAATAVPVTINVQPFSVLGAGITAQLVLNDPAIVNPRAIAADPQSLATNPVLYVADSGGSGAIHRIAYDRVAGTSTRTAFATGENFRGVEWDAAGDFLYASADNTIRVYDRTGLLVRVLSIAGASTLEHLTFGPGGFLYASDSNSVEVYRITNLITGTRTIFADNGTPRTGGGQSLDQPMGIAFAPVLGLSSNLFVSDVSRDVVYELLPDADLDGATDQMSVFMLRNVPALGPDPDVVYGVEYKRTGGAFGDQLFVANNGNERILAAVRDDAIVNDADLLSDAWSAFLVSVGRDPVDMAFHPSERMYVLFDQGNGMDPHVVELSGF